VANIPDIIEFLFQRGPFNRSLRHNGLQHDNWRYVDVRNNLHNRFVRIFTIVLLFEQRSQTVSLPFLSVNLDGIISDYAR